ncbi:response regulator transcription factor [bacterium]|nr:response regulator transcription factor [bacterium]
MSQNLDQNPKARILIVEDELPMRRALEDCLNHQGYRVLTTSNGSAGLDMALNEKPDLVLLDVMMPEMNGFDVCASLRQAGSSMPVLMLTAKGEIQDRVQGLDAGADDYLTKPFSTEELLARVRALLRRHQRSEGPAILQLGEVRVDLARQETTRKNCPLGLTAREYAMLRLLAQAEGAPVSRDQFLDQAWGFTSFPSTRTVDTHIMQLRKKIETHPEEPRWIQTAHGVGYRLILSDDFTKS